VASLLRQQDGLAKFGELALRSDSLDDLLDEGCRLVSEALGTDFAEVMELDRDGTTLSMRAGVGRESGFGDALTVDVIEGSFAQYALSTREPLVSEDIRTERRFEHADFVRDSGIRAIASVIILGAGNKPPFGLLQVDSCLPRRFSKQDTRFLQGCANLMAAAVDRLSHSERIRTAATHDPMTSLPNRDTFRNVLAQSLRQAQAAGQKASLLLIDVDRFKQINDLRGHPVGDAALRAVAARLVEALPKGIMVARLSGDEFAAILTETDNAAAARHADRALDGLRRSFSVEGRDVDLRASVGISTFPDDGTVPSQLIGNADTALNAAKRDGGGTARAYTPLLRVEHHRQLAMLRHARAALNNAWISPFYQPQISLATGEVRGFEALLRWHHPRVGMQYPATIACAFDDPSTAGLIGTTIMEAALSRLRRWVDSGLAIQKLAVNVSPAEFRDFYYGERLLDRLAERGLSSTLLEIEVTESAFVGPNVRNVVTTLEKLRAAGISVALDDFGTGFSSLSHLRDLPVDTIKIDRSFVNGIDRSPRDRAITEAVLMLGEALGMTTIAEGVETATQALFLKTNGCTYAQGFLIAPALDALQAEAVMHRDSPAYAFSPGGLGSGSAEDSSLRSSGGRVGHFPSADGEERA
jgi:diguanylate cyclase (GGDEF)-like protein